MKRRRHEWFPVSARGFVETSGAGMYDGFRTAGRFRGPSAMNVLTAARPGSDEDRSGLLFGRSIRCGRLRRFGQAIAGQIRSARTAVLLLLMTHAGLLAYSATRHSPTIDEPGHLVAGLSHWKFGRFELYRVNPPLVRMIAALPVMAAGYEEDWSGFYEHPGARPVFGMGGDFIEANGERSIRLFTIARWACIPISLAGGLFCFFWSRELWGSSVAGLVSLTLWCFEPNILAHGELITPDCAATSFGLGAGYFFWRWLKKPSWGRALAAGLLLGIAELSKMTWVILFGLWPLLWLFWTVSERRRISNAAADAAADGASFDSPPFSRSRIAQMAAILLLGLYVLNLGYGFDGTFTRLKDFTFVSSALTGEPKPGTRGNRFSDTPLAGLPVPVPRQYLLGMDVQKRNFEHCSEPSYLRGEWKDGGWWYYYIYGLAVKTPHGTQFLLLLAMITLIGRHWKRSGSTSQGSGLSAAGAAWRDLIVLLCPAIVVLVLVSSQLEFNHHVRYVLPVLGFVFVFIGSVAAGVRTTAPACGGGHDSGTVQAVRSVRG